MDGPYRSAGFTITRPVDSLSPRQTDRIPSPFITLPPCLSTRIPDTWCIEWASDPIARSEAEQAFSLDDAAVAKITDKVTEGFDDQVGWPSAIYDLEFATELFELVLPYCSQAKLIGLELSESNADKLVEYFQDDEPRTNAASGLLRSLKNNESISVTYKRIGFELLSCDYGLEHSWVCNSLEVEAATLFGTRLNHFGLVEDANEAHRLAEWINDPATGAEPGLWLPWRLVDCTPQAS
jgi:hypothetical protein